ncbi:MAG: HAMP domain-containing protein [Myxococcales bacterium]|nr:HAMP domain-containing protein [Myxococcales bacterium]
MKIRTRLVLVLAVFAAVILTVTITAVTAFSRLGQAVSTTIAENLRSIEAAQAMRQAIDRQDRGYLLILAGQGGRGRDAVAAAVASFEEQLDVARNNVTVEGEGELIEALEKAYDRYRKAAEPFQAPPPPPLAAAFPPPATPSAPPPAGSPPMLPARTDTAAPGEPANAAAALPAALPAAVPGTPWTPPAVAPTPPSDPGSDTGPTPSPASPAVLAGGLPFDATTYFLLVDDRLADVHQALDDLAALNRYAIESAAKEASLHGWRRSAWVIVVGLFGLALAAVFGRRLYRAIAVPLETIEAGIEAVRRGNYARRIGLDTRDELGQIAAAVNAAADQFARLDAAREGQLRLHERLASAVLDAFGPDALVVDRAGEPLVVGRRARERLGPNPMQTLRAGAGGLIPAGEIDHRIQQVFESREASLPSPPDGRPAGIEVRPIFGRAGSVVGAAVVLPPS